MWKAGKAILWFFATLTVLIMLVWGASFLADEPVRRYLQGQINNKMKGYSVTIAELNFNPLNLGMSLKKFVLIQDSNPDTPVMDIPIGTFKINWTDLLKGELTAMLDLDHPHFTINHNRLFQKTEENKPLKTKGWRQTLSYIYPIKVHQIAIDHGELNYIPKNEDTSIHFTDVFFRADNIHLAANDDSKFPSGFKLYAKIFDEGQLRANGRANFLTDPHVIFRTRYSMDQVALAPLAALFPNMNLSIDAGRMSSAGEFEYTNYQKILLADSIKVDKLKCDYLYERNKTALDNKENKGSPLKFEIKKLQVKGEIGFINRYQEPSYRIYMTNTVIEAAHLSDHLGQAEASVNLEGQFMNSGNTFAAGKFRQLQRQPVFQLTVNVAETQLKYLNDLLRAYAGLDAGAGFFSVSAKVTARNSRLDGFVKPLITSADFYNLQKKHGEALLGQMYEGFSDLMTNFLQNEKNEIGRKVSFTGSLKGSEANSWKIITNIIQQAFLEGIIPGFESKFVDN